MIVEPLKIVGSHRIVLQKFGDARGYFMSTYLEHSMREHNLVTEWVQDNEAWNDDSGIIRGFHFQAPPHDETKLVRVVKGIILDVFVDIRKGSPTFGQWEAVELSSEACNMVYIPKGCAHAYCTISEDTIVSYKVDSGYAPDYSGGIRWDDKALNVPWPIDKLPKVSEKDSELPCWEDFNSPFTF